MARIRTHTVVVGRERVTAVVIVLTDEADRKAAMELGMGPLFLKVLTEPGQPFRWVVVPTDESTAAADQKEINDAANLLRQPKKKP